MDDKNLLAIGRTNDLRMRIKQGLVRGKVPHSVGEKIRAAIKNEEMHPGDIGILVGCYGQAGCGCGGIAQRHKGKFGVDCRNITVGRYGWTGVKNVLHCHSERNVQRSEESEIVERIGDAKILVFLAAFEMTRM